MLLFDFDGTLSPTVPQPELARLPDRMRRVLTGLVEMPACRVGVVSGRGLDDLRIRADVPGLLLAGSGGLEWEIDGVRGAVPMQAVYAGNDANDAEAMAEVARRGGWTLAVGPDAPPADQRLDSPEALAEWLEALAATLRCLSTPARGRSV